MHILVIDVGGNNIKLRHPQRGDTVKVPSGPGLTAAGMKRAVIRAAVGWRYDVVSIGFPGPVKDGHPAREPHNLGGGWVRFDYARAFGRPVRIVNDAAMQALGGYEGGRMLYLGLGTGLGSALIVDHVLLPTELAHLPYRKGRTYEDYLGQRGYSRLGRARWAHHVAAVTAGFLDALQVEYVVLGGGNVKRLGTLPRGCRTGSNANAFIGGLRLWDTPIRQKARRESELTRGATHEAHAARRRALPARLLSWTGREPERARSAHP
jgi:polyphosphate glucokinase